MQVYEKQSLSGLREKSKFVELDTLGIESDYDGDYDDDDDVDNM